MHARVTELGMDKHINLLKTSVKFQNSIFSNLRVAKDKTQKLNVKP